MIEEFPLLVALNVVKPLLIVFAALVTAVVVDVDLATVAISVSVFVAIAVAVCAHAGKCSTHDSTGCTRGAAKCATVPFHNATS